MGGKVFSLSLAAHNPDRGNERENMKVLDLFSGIGGFSIGLEKAGFETVAFCEIEEYPRGVLKRHWPDIPIYKDVRELTGEQLRADGIIPDVIVGGYPCQPFSLAGVRRGEEDNRHLWPEVRRLINEIRPTWCIFENVAGHITMGLDEVLSDLEAEEYAARPFVIPACGVDAPHRRDRLWIVAHSNRSSDRRTSRQYEETNGEIPEWNDSGVVDQSSEVCAAALGNSDSTHIERGRLSSRIYKKLKISDSRSYYKRGKTAQFWKPEPSVGRVVNGLPNRTHRIKALGNAVVPQIPEVIGNIIMQIEGNND